MITPGKEAGAALLSILLIVATLSVAAVMATGVIARQTELQKLSVRRTHALWAARSAESVALASAADLFAASRLPASDTGEDPSRTLALPLDGGQIVLTLSAQAPCFNLNSLGNPDPALRAQHMQNFEILLADIGLPGGDAARVSATLADWIDADPAPLPLGGEDAAYLGQDSGFRAASQPLLSPAELAVLPGFTPDLRRALSAFTCTLDSPDAARLNMNALTADSAPVLRAATGGRLSLAEARRLIEARPVSGWPDVQAVRTAADRLPGAGEALAGLPLEVRSEHFTGTGTVNLDTGSWPFRFILRAGDGAAPEIIWRRFGGAA
ncbi:type II secretion system minor pseudopilin GspK [Hyphomonas sp.]|uniref:type II secretion system minor pseudopilin GspK n=1 Tax=Hyphomonas sp. TaxID=87 RepID=UPI0025C6EBE2|nr:type II secretion system minor pseudopilin GspK [Hyphomonas sp.]